MMHLISEREKKKIKQPVFRSATREMVEPKKGKKKKRQTQKEMCLETI